MDNPRKNEWCVKHGMSSTKTYTAWSDMKQRCLNTGNKQYKDYGGRGITICKRWMTFTNFLEDMGIAPEGLSLDRKNNEGAYCKRNCRWATRIEQQNTRQDTPMLTYKGVTKPLMVWARELGINHITLRGRIVTYGWSTRRALTEPVREKNFVHPRWDLSNPVPRNSRSRIK